MTNANLDDLSNAKYTQMYDSCLFWRLPDFRIPAQTRDISRPLQIRHDSRIVLQPIDTALFRRYNSTNDTRCNISREMMLHDRYVLMRHNTIE